MLHTSSARVKWLVAGIVFAALWASAATATKIGLTVAQPLVIAVVRFGAAAIIMLVIAHLIKRSRLPAEKEWNQIAVYGFLNITIYLGFYVIAMQTVSAGIGSLAIATNPVYISFLSVFFYNGEANHFDRTFWSSVGWLVIPVSIVAVQLWLWLLQTNAVSAGLWLFLCPLFGFVFAAWWMNDPISMYTIAGVVLVIGGLLLSKINARKNEVVFD